MLSWLFGKKKKKRKKAEQSRLAKPQNVQAPKPESEPAFSKRKKPGEVAENMGGPENIAHMIKAMIQEDKLK